MEDTQLYVMLLGIKFPWKINRVQVDMASNRIDVWIEEAPVTKFPCAVCTIMPRSRCGGTWAPASTKHMCMPVYRGRRVP